MFKRKERNYILATVVNITYQLKRAHAAKWIELNPILESGEPGFEVDTGLLKIGNGETDWLNLPYINDLEANVITADWQASFPIKGKVDKIYYAYNEKQLYSWSPTTQKYELLSIGNTQLQNYAKKEQVQAFYDSIIPLTENEILNICSNYKK